MWGVHDGDGDDDSGCLAQGYTFYIAILFILTAALVLSVILCVWVGWCFKNDRFPYIW